MSRKSFEKYYTTLKEALEDGENIDDTDFKILERRLSPLDISNGH